MNRKPGRKSAASLAVVPFKPRPQISPPRTMSPAAAKIWRATVAAVPPDWFDAGTLPLLVGYCTHVTTAAYLSAKINHLMEADLTPAMRKELKSLLGMHSAEVRSFTALARAMRLTQGSRFRRETAGSRMAVVQPAAKKPWE